MIPTLYEPFRHWSDGGSVYILADIPSIHRVTIDNATERKQLKEESGVYSYV